VVHHQTKKPCCCYRCRYVKRAGEGINQVELDSTGDKKKKKSPKKLFNVLFRVVAAAYKLPINPCCYFNSKHPRASIISVLLLPTFSSSSILTLENLYIPHC